MRQRLLQHLNFAKPLRLALVLSTLLLTLPLGVKAQIPWIFIGHYDYTTQGTLVGTMVTDANASNVLGDNTVSYADGVLTLNGANIQGTIYCKEDLTIDLKGNNYITANDSNAIKNSESTTSKNLTFISSNGTGKLEMKGKGNPCTSGFNSPTYQDGLSTLLGAYNNVNAVIGKQLFSGGTGTSSDPYIIGSAYDLKSFSFCFNNNLINTGACAKIADSVESLDFSGINDFEPIGDDNNKFRYTFDGNNKTIKNLSITGDNGANVGIFRSLTTNGKIENLTLDNLTITGGSTSSSFIGGLVGYMDGGTISGCTIQNSSISCLTTTSNPSVGGFVGSIGGSATISNSNIVSCVVKAETSSTGDSGPCAIGGGIAGTIMSGSVSGCRVKGTTAVSANYGDQTIESIYAGALVGNNNGGTLSDNAYEYTVTAKAKTTTKSEYTQRGIGSTNYDEPGAMLAGTKKITVSDYDVNKGNLVLSENNEAYCIIERNSSEKIIALYVIPTQNFAINASLEKGVENVKSRLTVKNGTADIEMTATEVENTTTHVYTHTEYAFTMPDADLTATLTFPIDIASTSFTASIADGYYTGTAVVPTQMTLAGGTNNYTLTTANNDFTITGYTLGGTAVTEPVEAGTYTVSVEGKGDYIGTRDVSYKIIMTYALKIKDIQVNELNKDNILGSAGTATVSFTPATATTPNKLALNGASFEGKIENGLDELTIEFTGTNSLTGTSGYITSTNTNAVLTVKGVTGTSTLSITNTVDKPAVEGFASLTLDGAYLKTDFASQYVPGNSPAIRNVKGGTVASATFTTTLYYPLWVYNQQVSGTNYTNVLNDGTVSYVHNDANNTGTLTLNGASIDSSDAIEGFLNGLIIYLKGDNSLRTYTNEYSPICSGIGTAELTIAKHPDATGDVSLSLTYAGTAVPVISGFASVSYSGLNFVSKTGSTLDGATTYDAVLSSAVIYPLWIDGTMVTEANKNSILGNTSVTYDGDANNGGTNTLTLTNYSYTGVAASDHAIVTNISGLKVKLVGASTIDCTANSNYAFYTSQSASIQFVKNNATSKLTLKTTPANPFGGFADGKITYDGLVYYSEGKYIAVPTAPVMAEDNNKVKLTKEYEDGDIYYTIDYADETADVAKTKYTAEFEMDAPGTVEAWVEANGAETSPVKGKYFGYKDAIDAPFTLKADLDDPAKSETLTPELIPALMDGENIGYKATGAYESSAEGVATFTGGTITAVGIGTATVTANLDYKSDGQPVVILNPEKKVTAEVNVGVTPSITFQNGMTYATYCNTTETDMTVPEGLKAYAITGVNENVVTLAEVDFLPKKDGTDYVALLLRRDDTSAAIGLALEATGGTRPTTNYLKYNYTGDDIIVETTYNWYVLYKNEFVKATGSIPDKKCYLDLNGVAAPAPARSLGIDDDGTTVIHEIDIENEESREEWYDLQGRRIQQPTKAGLYIKNGKKVIVNTK